MRNTSGPRSGAALLSLALLLAGCGQDSGSSGPGLPPPSALEGLYGDQATVTLNGNVVDVRVRQDPDQIQRGGDLWTKVGPYIFLFSPQTREIFGRYPDVAAVRVRTFTPRSEWVAEAMLRRDALNALTWPEARTRVGRARTQGTQKPGYIEDLIHYGEERTEHRYNPDFLEGG